MQVVGVLRSEGVRRPSGHPDVEKPVHHQRLEGEAEHADGHSEQRQAWAAPRATINPVAHAGACGQDKRLSRRQVPASVSDAPTSTGQPVAAGSIGTSEMMRSRADGEPDGIPTKWPRMTERGAAAGENG